MCVFRLSSPLVSVLYVLSYLCIIIINYYYASFFLVNKNYLLLYITSRRFKTL